MNRLIVIRTKYYRFIPLVILLFTSARLHADSTRLQLGFGNFEGFHIGLKHAIKKGHFFYGYGNDLNMYNQGMTNVVYLGAGRKILNKWHPVAKRLSLDFRALAWNLENRSFVFSVATFSPELHLTFFRSELFDAEIYGGMTYSTVFRYKRKTYQEVGWPRVWLPSFGITLNRKWR